MQNESALAQQVEELKHRLDGAATDADRSKVRTQLAELLGKQFDIRQKRHGLEIECSSHRSRSSKNWCESGTKAATRSSRGGWIRLCERLKAWAGNPARVPLKQKRRTLAAFAFLNSPRWSAPYAIFDLQPAKSPLTLISGRGSRDVLMILSPVPA